MIQDFSKWHLLFSAVQTFSSNRFIRTRTLAEMWCERATYIFARQEVHGPLDVLDRNTAADMRLCRLDPHFSKEVHDTWVTMQIGKRVNQDPEFRDCTCDLVLLYLVGCTVPQRRPTNRSGKPAPHQAPPPGGAGWSQPVPQQEPQRLRCPPLVPKSFQSCWTWKREEERNAKTCLFLKFDA